ncbi:hypothetical protein [Mesobacillus jeotgali]|uniref:hypothetical protein n=1 Tax=Mesobacillus jeotgali TaxID=129985 RepID=UPI000C828D84|nr:hypothetical protein [Mesobacillus jeotgali]
MIKVDRKALDKTIDSMNLFPETKKAVAEYKENANLLDQRETMLKEQMAVIQKKHTENLMNQQVITDISELIYLKKQAKELVYETNVINSLLEELSEERTAVKLKYVPIFQQAIEDDRRSRPDYHVNQMVELIRWELVKAVADLSQAMQTQQKEVSAIHEVMNDPTVKVQYPRIEYMLNTKVQPVYSESFDTVLSRYHMFAARDGQIPSDIKRPMKEGK